MKKGPKLLHGRDEEDHNQPDDRGSQLAVKTPEGPFLEAYFDPQPRISRRCTCQLRQWDWELPLTPLPPSLLPLIVRTQTYTGDRLPEAEVMAVGLPATPEEDERGPPSGRPISRCPARRMNALYPPPQVL